MGLSQSNQSMSPPFALRCSSWGFGALSSQEAPVRTCFNLSSTSAVVFISGSGLYKRNPPQGNIMLRVCGCIGVGGVPPGSELGAVFLFFFFFTFFASWLFFLQFAIKNRWQRSKHDADRKHWLDWAEEKYSVRTAPLATKLSFFRPLRLNVRPSFCISTEAPDPGGQDGAAGAGPVHPAANVLGPF